MRRMGLAFGLVTLLAATPAVHAAGEAIELLGRGVQIYLCQPDSGAFAWHLKGPEAALLDASGVVVGSHFAGPSWRAADGSTVVGELLGASPAPHPGAIPWLVLRAKSHEGAGRFATVALIVRARTSGGVAPTDGCDSRHLGAEARIGYEATYLLFPAS